MPAQLLPGRVDHRPCFRIEFRGKQPVLGLEPAPTHIGGEGEAGRLNAGGHFGEPHASRAAEIDCARERLRPLDHVEGGLLPVHGKVVRGPLELDLRGVEQLAVIGDRRLVLLEIDRQMRQQPIDGPLTQSLRGVDDPGDQRLGPDWTIGGLRVRHLTVLQVVRPNLDHHECATPGFLCNGLPAHDPSDPSGTEPASTVLPMKLSHAGTRPGCIQLPRGAELAERLNCLAMSHPVSVVGHANLFDPIQLVASEGDLHVLCIRIEAVPDQLEDRHRGMGSESLKVMLVEIDVELHGGRVSQFHRHLGDAPSLDLFGRGPGASRRGTSAGRLLV